MKQLVNTVTMSLAFPESPKSSSISMPQEYLPLFLPSKLSPTLNKGQRYHNTPRANSQLENSLQPLLSRLIIIQTAFLISFNAGGLLIEQGQFPYQLAYGSHFRHRVGSFSWFYSLD